MNTINPGVPAIKEVIIRVPAVPPSVTVTIDLHEALMLAAVQGTSTGRTTDLTLYKLLNNHPLFREYYLLAGQAIAHGAGGCYRWSFSEHEFSECYTALKKKALEVVV